MLQKMDINFKHTQRLFVCCCCFGSLVVVVVVLFFVLSAEIVTLHKKGKSEVDTLKQTALHPTGHGYMTSTLTLPWKSNIC